MTLDMGAVIGLAQSNNPEMVEKLGCFDLPGRYGVKPASLEAVTHSSLASKALTKQAIKKEFVSRSIPLKELLREPSLDQCLLSPHSTPL